MRTKAILLSVFIIFLMSCNRPECENKNSVFNTNEVASNEYKKELIKEIQRVENDANCIIAHIPIQLSDIEKYDKKYVCKFFNWQLSKPIGIIMANDLTDGLFNHKWEIYRDNYIWLREVIKFASMNSNINWIVKPHPNDIKNDDAQKVKKIFEKNIHPNHIKFFPENWGKANYTKFQI